MNINKLRARKRAPTKMALQILSPEWVCPRLSLVNKLQYYGIWISGSLFFASLLLTDKRDTPLTLGNSNKAYCWRDTFLWLNIKGTDEGILFWDSFPGRRLNTVHDINWRHETVVLILLGGPLVWQLGQYSCRSTESCLSVMVRWVASSGHIADDRVSVQEVEVLQNFVMLQLCVSLCFVCSLFCK